MYFVMYVVSEKKVIQVFIFISGDGELAAAKWEALYYHITNRHHDLPNQRFTQCEHGDIEERVWLEEGLLHFTNFCEK